MSLTPHEYPRPPTGQTPMGAKTVGNDDAYQTEAINPIIFANFQDTTFFTLVIIQNDEFLSKLMNIHRCKTSGLHSHVTPLLF